MPRDQFIATMVTPAHVKKSQREHEQLIEAIHKGDAEGAETNRYEHVIATKTRVHAVATVW